MLNHWLSLRTLQTVEGPRFRNYVVLEVCLNLGFSGAHEELVELGILPELLGRGPRGVTIPVHMLNEGCDMLGGRGGSSQVGGRDGSS